jgi:hypothetical protein
MPSKLGTSRRPACPETSAGATISPAANRSSNVRTASF